jgi:hypothetical protein
MMKMIRALQDTLHGPDFQEPGHVCQKVENAGYGSLSVFLKQI